MGTALLKEIENKSSEIREAARNPSIPQWSESAPITGNHASESSSSRGQSGAHKTVEVLDSAEHKPTSDMFRRRSRKFETGEFTHAVASKIEADQSSSSSSSEDGDEALPNQKPEVRILEVPGHGESSPTFRRRSHEFQKNEFTFAQEAWSKASHELEDTTPPKHLRKERSKTMISKADPHKPVSTQQISAIFKSVSAFMPK